MARTIEQVEADIERKESLKRRIEAEQLVAYDKESGSPGDVERTVFSPERYRETRELWTREGIEVGPAMDRGGALAALIRQVEDLYREQDNQLKQG